MHCRVASLLIALFVFASLEQLSQASCDTRTLRNNLEGPLEVCERNANDDKVFLPLCTGPTAAKTASVYCLSTPCESTCNQYNYTVAYKPENVTGFIYQCEPNDNKPKQCELTIGLCDSVIQTLNCECNTSSCPDDYVSPRFCANNTCSCTPEFDGAYCLESVCEIGLLRTSTESQYTSAVEMCADPFGVHDWFPICTSSSDFLSIVRPICGRTSHCKRLDCVRANFTYTPSINSTMGYSVVCQDPLDILSQCTLIYGLCSNDTSDILATLECLNTCSMECQNGGFCLLNNTCLCPFAYTGETCELASNTTSNPPENHDYKMEFLVVIYAIFPIVVVCILLLICVIALVVYIRSRPSKLKALENVIIFAASPRTQSMRMENNCVTTEEVVYASVKVENMLENTSDRTIGNRYTTSSRYALSAVSSNSSAGAQTSPSRHTRNIDSSSISVENQLYLSVLPNARPILTNSCTSSIQNNPYMFSSSIALSSRQRLESVQADTLKQGESYFTNNLVFLEPPTDVEGIYNTLADFKFREISPNSISLQQQLGSGYFGDVLRAEWKTEQDTEPIPVAAKCLNENADSKLRLSFLTEAAIMGQFDHPNVLRLLGIVSLTEPYMLVIELMEGDLKNILQSIAVVKFDNDKLMLCLLNCTREIVCGMEYLSSKHFVHRDLALRNVLVGQDMVCRIGDFGMSKRMHEDKDYYRVESGNVVPVRWTAPEALFFRRYSEKSDVWSLGMTLFEVWSVGWKPWSRYTNEQVLGFVTSNEIQGPPTGCPREIYAIMVKTWSSDPAARPTFREIAQLLKEENEQLLNLPENAGQLGNDPDLSVGLYSDLRN